MSALLSYEQSIDAVRRAGEVIAGDLTWTPANQQRIREAFSVANQWRDSHAHPMRSIHHTLRYHIRHQDLGGFTAARLKRMNAIRGKLRRMNSRKRPLGLETLQDLGGCRAIMATMKDADALILALRERCRHVLWDQNDYIHEARATGYRSHHLKFEYRGTGDKKIFDGRRVEVQVRTDLQHAWATAVEAIGLFRGEELKSGKGSPEWLRLFALMSGEFAEAERCDPPKGVPDRAARLRELKELNGQLGAVDVLKNLSHAVFWSQDAVSASTKPSYYLIKYDNITRSVTVIPQFESRFAFESYEKAESADNFSGSDTANVVLIEADKMDGLTKAYPNYFGDTLLFNMQLNKLLSGGVVEEYEVALQKRSIPTPREQADPSWIGRRGLWVEPRRKAKKDRP
ncbi:RelA/SpoT domain-containing protein [Caulobacter segnis]